MGPDLEERFVEGALEFAEEKQLESMSFRAMDASAIDLPDESFDTVAINNSLHHLDKVESAFDEMHRVLKPGGIFIVAEMYRDGQSPRRQMHVDYHHWWAAIDRRLGIPHNPTYTRREIEELLGARPFAEEEFLVQEWPEEEDQSEKALRPLIDMNEKVLARLEGHAGHEELKAQGEQLKRRLLETGWASAQQLIFIGRK